MSDADSMPIQSRMQVTLHVGVDGGDDALISVAVRELCNLAGERSSVLTTMVPPCPIHLCTRLYGS
jgi:hypothetical protein